jgi:hypothetical protein
LKSIKEYVRIKFNPDSNMKSTATNGAIVSFNYFLLWINLMLKINQQDAEKAQFFLPCSLTQEQLNQQIRTSLEELDKSLDNYREELIATVNQDDTRHREIELLREKLAEYKLVVDKQAKLIEMSLAQQSKRAATAEKDGKSAMMYAFLFISGQLINPSSI